MHTRDVFSNLCVTLRLSFILLHSLFNTGLAFSVFFRANLGHFVIIIFTVNFCFCSTSQQSGWEEHFQNDLFCVKLGIKPNSINITSMQQTQAKTTIKLLGSSPHFLNSQAIKLLSLPLLCVKCKTYSETVWHSVINNKLTPNKICANQTISFIQITQYRTVK